MLKKIISIFLFLVAGILSAYIFQLYEGRKPFTNGFYPGLIFIATTFIIFRIWKIQFEIYNWILYLMIMYVLYLAVFFAGYYTYGMGSPFTCGLGAVLLFLGINHLIVKIEYNGWILFLLGFLCPVLNWLIVWSPFADIIAPFYSPEKASINGQYASSFFFWELIIGIKLTQTITNRK